MGIAALVLGILSIIFVAVPFLNLVLGIVGIVLGALGMKKDTKYKSLAKAGLVTSIVGLSITVLVVVCCAVCGAIAGVHISNIESLVYALDHLL